MALSESFLGDSTFFNLEGQVNQAMRNDFDSSIIEESPTNSKLLQTTRRFQKSKSESTLDDSKKGKLTEKEKEEDVVNEDFFKEDFSFNLPSEQEEPNELTKMSLVNVAEIEAALSRYSMQNEFDNTLSIYDSESMLDAPICSEDVKSILKDEESNLAIESIENASTEEVNNIDYSSFIFAEEENQEIKDVIQNELNNSKKYFPSNLPNENNSVPINDRSLNSMSQLKWTPETQTNPTNVGKKQITKGKFENLKCIASWNLPTAILHQYEKKGIKEMFDWQVECLQNSKVIFEHRNLVYSAPTSAGKTLVSEIHLIKTIIERRKKAIFILPFISVVREKMFYLQDLLVPAGYRVDGFYGGYNPPGGFETLNVAICTIEKANSIVNKLLEQSNIDEIGIIVVDEIHLISDPGRGYILELLLAKIMYVSKKNNLQIQIVTMSATLSNVELLRNWLDAEFYITDFRPVELQEMIKIGNNIFDSKMKLLRELKPENLPHLKADSDNLAQLCIETLSEGCSVLVFCPSKDWCESLSKQLAEAIHCVGRGGSDIGDRLRECIQPNLIDDVKKKLRDTPTGLDPFLDKVLTFACAFHHAGLTAEERDIIESSFKLGALKILVATSTLSSGVNLPARRVIVRSPLFGGKQMNILTYRQMIGRAGRTGKDTLGESILICTAANANIGKDLLSAELVPISSCLDMESRNHLKRALLEVISSGVVSTVADVNKFFDCTLLSKQEGYEKITNYSGNLSSQSLIDFVQDSIDFLVEYEFIRLQKNDETNEKIYVATRLGKACLASSMPPNDGLILFGELQRSRRCFVLESELHAVYLVTPYSVCYQIQDLDWFIYLDMWENLSPAMKKVGELVGVKESFLVRAMRGQRNLDYKLMQVHKRFYIALALHELVNETPINTVASKYKCSRGLLQTLQQMSSSFAGIVTSFCNSLNWTLLALIVSQFKERLFFGVHHDLIDLMRLPQLNQKRARALFDAGITNLIELANADHLQVENILFNSLCFDSAKQHDEENEFEANQRNNARAFFITGKSGLTIQEASKILINEARAFVQYEIGAGNIRWSQSEDTCENKNEEISHKRKSKDETFAKNSSPKMTKSEIFEESVRSPQSVQSSSKLIPETERKVSKNKTEIAFDVLKSNNISNISNFSANRKMVEPRHVEEKPSSFHKNIPDPSLQIEKILPDEKENFRKLYEKTKPLQPTRRSPRNHLTNSTRNGRIVGTEKSVLKMKSLSVEAQVTIPEDKSSLNKSSEEIGSSQQLCENIRNTQKKLRSFRSQRQPTSCNEGNSFESLGFKTPTSLSEIFMENLAVKNPIHLNSSHILSTKDDSDGTSFNSIDIIDICGNIKLFDMAFEEIIRTKRFGFSLGIQKQINKCKPVIGSNLLINKGESTLSEQVLFPIDGDSFAAGISFTLTENIVYYLNLQGKGTCNELTSEKKFNFVQNLLQSTENTMIIFDSREQLKALRKSMPNLRNIRIKLLDPKIANWLLTPDTQLNITELAQQFAPECKSLVKLGGRCRNHNSMGLNANSGILAKVRCAIESYVSIHILQGQIEILQRIRDGDLYKAFTDLEMPLQLSLCNMEIYGFPSNGAAIERLFQKMVETMGKLEMKIYEMHGSRFNLSSSAAVAKVVGTHRKVNNRYCTSKHILEKIESPIAQLIIDYRKLNVILTKNIQPLLRNVIGDRIHGQSVTFTSTGRISMCEPNLQNVAKDFEITLSDSEKVTISCRSAFFPSDRRCLISSDFCQLEMRILAHLSQDPNLMQVMKSKIDLFVAIAAKWNKIEENQVSENLRNSTKQICYAIVYGMGIKSLSESLKCSEQEAFSISEQFHAAFPGIRNYIEKVIRFARHNGYVETLTGRRRFINLINSSKLSLKNQAERQAVNSTIQGSAADIAKSAVLRMEKNVSKYHKKLGIDENCVNLVLILHDELIFEVPEDKAEKIAKILSITMENCVKINVPLKVKLKIGKSWGSLKEVKL